jgi:hypothetical protein
MNILDFRKIENLHILLWLIKDLCWVADWKWMGTFMIAPTLGVAFWLTYKMRKSLTELMNNLAVICWICANATWMIGEFFFKDGTRSYAVIIFGVGLSLLAVYYSSQFLKSWRKK